MKKNIFGRIKDYAVTHKFTSTIIVIIIVAGGYYWYHTATSIASLPQYALSSVRNGSIIQTVSGTGQVSASNQTDIQSQVSGTIESIDVSVGQAVSAGDLIATIDSTDAKLSLDNAQISFAKLTEPAKATDISNALNNLAKSYNDGFSSASTIYLDLPAIMSGLKDLLYGQTGFLSDQNATYLSSTARAMRDISGVEYDAAVLQYQKSLAEFRGLTRSSATSSLDSAYTDTFETIQMVAKSATDAQNAITFIVNTQPNYQPKSVSTAASSINTWTAQANSDLSSLASSQNSIQNNKNTYTTLVNGADQYDIQSAQVSLAQQQKTYANYFIKAPYDGVIGRIPVNVYGQASGGTTIATIVGTQMQATISLDEVSAAKVKVGQSATITFNAISGLTATGTVSVVDQIGTVTSGVVSYGIKITINTQDDRIRPGMSINTNITTYEKDSVLIVPNSAVKTQGSTNYVQIFDQATVASSLGASSTGRIFASSTRPYQQTGSSTSSPANTFTGSSTRQYTGQNSGNGGGRAITITTSLQPVQTTVVTGDSDDTNTEIVSGLTRGQFVVTKTLAGSATQMSTTAPSLLSSLSGGRAGATGGGATRALTGGGGGAARPAGN